MTQREKWLTVLLFVLMFGVIVLIFTVGLDQDPKPSRTPGVQLPTGVQCDPSC